MSVTTTNLIMGPATIYGGTFGAAEPATLATVPASPFVDLGATQDGVAMNINDDYAALEVDQVIYEPERRRTKRVITLKTNLAEATLANLAISLNDAAPVASVFSPSDGLAAFNPAYQAIILDGIAPTGTRRRIIARKVLATEAVEFSYKKDGQTLIPVTFTLHWVSSSILPFIIKEA